LFGSRGKSYLDEWIRLNQSGTIENSVFVAYELGNNHCISKEVPLSDFEPGKYLARQERLDPNPVDDSKPSSIVDGDQVVLNGVTSLNFEIES